MINDRLWFLNAVPFLYPPARGQKVGTAFSLLCSIDDMLAKLVWDRVCI